MPGLTIVVTLLAVRFEPLNELLLARRTRVLLEAIGCVQLLLLGAMVLYQTDRLSTLPIGVGLLTRGLDTAVGHAQKSDGFRHFF